MKKTDRTDVRTLKLSRETLARLTGDELAGVNGGMAAAEMLPTTDSDGGRRCCDATQNPTWGCAV